MPQKPTKTAQEERNNASEGETMNTKERLVVGIGMALLGVMLMNVREASISTLGSMLFGIGMTLFLTNIKE
jgi:hypothetical protein